MELSFSGRGLIHRLGTAGVFLPVGRACTPFPYGYIVMMCLGTNQKGGINTTHFYSRRQAYLVHSFSMKVMSTFFVLPTLLLRLR